MIRDELYTLHDTNCTIWHQNQKNFDIDASLFLKNYFIQIVSYTSLKSYALQVIPHLHEAGGSSYQDFTLSGNRSNTIN
jgi:hypothetical protein